MNKEHPTAEVEAVTGPDLIERLGEAMHELSSYLIPLLEADYRAHEAYEKVVVAIEALSTKESDLRADNERLRALLQDVEQSMQVTWMVPDSVAQKLIAALQGSAS